MRGWVDQLIARLNLRDLFPAYAEVSGSFGSGNQDGCLVPRLRGGKRSDIHEKLLNGGCSPRMRG